MNHRWSTRLPAGLTRQHGVDEIHASFLAPAGWPGAGPCVSLLIPECEMQLAVCIGGEPLVAVNRPPHNKKITRWLRCACKTAKEAGALFVLSCDTVEDVEKYTKMALGRLPNYSRVPMERMEDPTARRASGLN